MPGNVPSSSSFIEPPATGHHQWSGAKRFSIFSFLQYFLHYTRYDDDIFDKTTKMAQYSFRKNQKSTGDTKKHKSK
jgi:hypothetical protein